MKRYVRPVAALLLAILYLGLTVFSVWTGHYPRAVIDLALTAAFAYFGTKAWRRQHRTG